MKSGSSLSKIVMDKRKPLGHLGDGICYAGDGSLHDHFVPFCHALR